MRRRILFLLAAVFAVGIVGVALLPWWLGAAIPLVAKRYGVTFERYERLSYSRFALHNVEYHRGTVHVKAARVETDSASLWAWRHLRGAGSDTKIGKWTVE